ncbi:inactive protein RESTRICTED TEV MOVEMENT 2-like [Olea europaea var. sylvestris]|nr:inactive protein RESTRICTED TEV MOVEMENT 2-like [Olea europaea var. sylvestris]CAA3005502.1 kDa class I heat shock -like [Olea europaea subsp. europaea]
MEAKPVNTLFEEFEPLSKWKHKEDRDILEIHVPEFKKEQLKVRINRLKLLKISGELPLDAQRKSRFYKEVPIPKNIDATAINAKFCYGWLYIAMPKKLPISEDQKTPEFRLRTFGKVVVTLATLAALIAFVVYMYRSVVPEIV